MTTTQAVTGGLRELKKQQTRQAISDHATRLFIERGFDKVTIADVAAAAQVAKMTVTNYFPRKEDLALDHQDEFVASLARTVAARPAGDSAFGALRAAYRGAIARQDPVLGFSGPMFARMIADSPALTARLRDFHDLREQALAGELARETGDVVRARVAAALLAAVHRTLFEETLRRTLDGQSNPEIAAALAVSTEEAFAVLEPALRDYAVREV